MTYIGEVPMSPYTTPMVTSMAPRLMGMVCALGCSAPLMVFGGRMVLRSCRTPVAVFFERLSEMLPVDPGAATPSVIDG